MCKRRNNAALTVDDGPASGFVDWPLESLGQLQAHANS
jgi:hypothetical protein